MKYRYRIVPRMWGFEPQMYTNGGLCDDFWMPLLRTGYWAEPWTFSYGRVKKNKKTYPISLRDAVKAVKRAKLINSGGLVRDVSVTASAWTGIKQ